MQPMGEAVQPLYNLTMYKTTQITLSYHGFSEVWELVSMKYSDSCEHDCTISGLVWRAREKGRGRGMGR